MAATSPTASAPRLDDPALRAAIRSHLARRRPTALLVDELTIASATIRADVVAVTATALHGIELKGEGDSLARLPAQVVGYSAVFDTATVVCTANHLAGVLLRVPLWWEAQLAMATPSGQVRLIRHRPGLANPAPTAEARLDLLWRDELAALATTYAPQPGLSRLPRWKLIPLLADVLTPVQAGRAAATALRARTDWLDATGGARARSAEWKALRERLAAERAERTRRHTVLLEGMAARAEQIEREGRTSP